MRQESVETNRRKLFHKLYDFIIRHDRDRPDRIFGLKELAQSIDIAKKTLKKLFEEIPEGFEIETGAPYLVGEKQSHNRMRIKIKREFLLEFLSQYLPPKQKPPAPKQQEKKVLLEEDAALRKRLEEIEIEDLVAKLKEKKVIL